jgi:hypothetical protein
MTADLNDASNAAFPIFRFINVTANALIGVQGQSAGTSTSFGGECSAFATITVAANTQIALRAVNTFTVSGNNANVPSLVRFDKIAGNLPVGSTTRARVKRTCNTFAVTANGTATVQFATSVYDALSNMNATTFTAPRAGIYSVKVTLGLSWISGSSGSQSIIIRKNAAAYSGNGLVWQAAPGGVTLSISDDVDCAAGDTIDIQFNSNSITSPNVTGHVSIIENPNTF